MRVPYLPEILELKLERDLRDPGAPVFQYRPLTLTEAVEATARIAPSDADPSADPEVENQRRLHATRNRLRMYADLFRERVVKIRNLTIGDADEEFDPKKESHLNALDLGDIIEIGSGIFNRARLEDDLAGKSSSPSN